MDFKKCLGLGLVLLSLVGCGGGGGSDGGGGSATGGTTPPVNVAPTANAGVDQTVDELTAATLSGSGSDTDGSIASYQWEQTAGTSVTLTNANSASASFTVPDINADETFTFKLTVTDDDGASSNDSISVNANYIQPTGQAILGPLAGAEINVYHFSDLTTSIETVTADNSQTDLTKSGSFKLVLTDVSDDEWLVVSATGGEDIDVDDNGVVDTTPTNNNGTIHAIATGADWRVGGNINLLTEIVWQQVKLLEPDTDEFQSALQTASVGVLSDDINGDTTVDYRDLIVFNPQNSTHISSTSIDYQVQLTALASKIHNNDTTTLSTAINDLYGDTLLPIELVKLIPYTPTLTVPTNVNSITSSDLTVTSFVGDGDTIIDSQQPTLLMAEDSNGSTVLLGFAIPNVDDNIMSANNVEMSPKSTALALIMLKISVSGEEASAEMAANVLAHDKFSELESLITDAFVNDPTFLDNLAYYKSIVELLSNISKEVFNTYLQQLTEQQEVNIAQFSVQNKAGRTAKALKKDIDDFWCTPITGWPCSPWHKEQPWTWYGETNAMNVTLPPFPASAVNDNLLSATANPTMINYILEMYNDAGEKIVRMDEEDTWYMTSRNSTIIQRIGNSNAAQTTHSTTGIFDERPFHIEYNKYWLDGGNTTPANVNRFFHLLHLTSGILNIVADARFISSYGEKVTKTLSNTAKAKELKYTITRCAISLASTVDYTSDSFTNFLKDNSFSIFETTVTGCVLPIVQFFGKDAAKIAVNEAFKSAFPKIAAKFSNPAGWAVIVFDAANELAPLSVSLFAADSVVGYDLTWDENGALTNAVRNDKRPNKPLAPTASFSATVNDLTVNLSATSSVVDETANPAYEWGLGDGNTSTGATITHTYVSAGIKDIRLTVYDGLDQSSEIYRAFELTNGSPPEIISLSCENDNGEVTTGIKLLDRDDDNQVTVDWYLNASANSPISSGITDTDGNANAILNYNFSAEQYIPVVKVTDTNGNQTIDSCATRLKTRGNIDYDAIFYDDFESDSTGQIPSQWVNGPWSDAGSNYVTDLISYSGNQSVHIQSFSSNQKGIYAPDTIIESDAILSTQFYLPDGGVSGYSFGGLDYTGVAVFFRYVGSDLAEIRSWSSDGLGNWSGTFSTETWHTLTVEFDYDGGQYEVFINDESMGFHSYLPNITIGFGKDLSLRGDNNQGVKTVYFDNISLTPKQSN
jgi:hypothetical protein